MKTYALIVAGGSGKRMGGATPKQFLLLKNKPILLRTLERIHSFDSSIEIIVALPEAHIDYWKSFARKYECRVEHKIVAGGETRFLSVQNALKEVREEGIVAIHDGVRPLVSPLTWENCMKAAQKHGAVIPVLEMTESVRQINENGSVAVDRDAYRLVQTPQTFRTEIIKAAYEQEYHDAFTDDASVVEKLGHKIHLVNGNRENIKITRQIDLTIANELIHKL